MRYAYDTAAVRAVEQRLLAAQRRPDELMSLAARAVAATAETMLEVHGPGPVVILVGPGGNGGDGLFAGALLAMAGQRVTAVLAGVEAHEAGLSAFSAAGGTLASAAGAEAISGECALLIDAVAGLGSARGLEGACLKAYWRARAAGAGVLAVDMPTGIDADTGVAAEGGDAVCADVTISFGLARAGHVHAPECGVVVLSDLQLDREGESFAAALGAHAPAGEIAYEPAMPSPYAWGTQPIFDHAEGKVTAPRPVGCTGPIVDPRPGIHSDKYSGGVVGVCAGSATYPGAGILCATAAVRTTPSLVRVIGGAEITATLPEVIVHGEVGSAGRVQCWVHGPGRGIDDAARAELEELLDRPEPLVLDADSITLLAQHPELRARLRTHPLTVLTPHAGEFARLYRAVFDAEPADALRATALARLSRELGCFILLKGRITTVCGPTGHPRAVNAGHSAAATPGSGDVLAGVIGAVLAQAVANTNAGEVPDPETVIAELLHSAAIHQHAAAIAAATPEGPGICSASQIAAALPQAIARLIAMER